MGPPLNHEAPMFFGGLNGNWNGFLSPIKGSGWVVSVQFLSMVGYIYIYIYIYIYEYISIWLYRGNHNQTWQVSGG